VSNLVINTASVEYVKVPVDVVKDGVVYDPTSMVVTFAFVAGHDLTDATWTTGGWETDDAGQHWARCLVGTDTNGVILAAGKYNVYVRVDDNPEDPVRVAAGQLVVQGSASVARALSAAGSASLTA